jgi:hypothetical protein
MTEEISTRKVFLIRFLVLVICLIISTGIMFNFVKPKPIQFTFLNRGFIYPNKPLFGMNNGTLEPTYGTNSAIIKGGFLYSSYFNSLNITYFASLDNETYVQLPIIYEVPILNQILSIYNPAWRYFGFREIGTVEGITEASKNVPVYTKFLWTPSKEEFQNFRNKSVTVGSVVITATNSFGSAEIPIFVLGALAITSFLITIYRFIFQELIENKILNRKK